MTTIYQAAASFEYGQIIEFIQIDFTQFGGGLFNVYNSIDASQAAGELTFQGQQWTPIPFESSGWMLDGAGGTPKPQIVIADANALLLTAMFVYSDAIGAPVYRYESTTEGYLEGSYYGPEIWAVNRIIQADGMNLKFELAAPFDQILRKVPNRQMFRTQYPGLAR
jgi:lambda family phage minor tail protein L